MGDNGWRGIGRVPSADDIAQVGVRIKEVKNSKSFWRIKGLGIPALEFGGELAGAEYLIYRYYHIDVLEGLVCMGFCVGRKVLGERKGRFLSLSLCLCMDVWICMCCPGSLNGRIW